MRHALASADVAPRVGERQLRLNAGLGWGVEANLKVRLSDEAQQIIASTPVNGESSTGGASRRGADSAVC